MCPPPQGGGGGRNEPSLKTGKKRASSEKTVRTQFTLKFWVNRVKTNFLERRSFLHWTGKNWDDSRNSKKQGNIDFKSVFPCFGASSTIEMIQETAQFFPVFIAKNKKIRNPNILRHAPFHFLGRRSFLPCKNREKLRWFRKQQKTGKYRF